MCRCNDSPRRRTKDSIGDADNHEDHRRQSGSIVSPSSISQSPSTEVEAGEVRLTAEMRTATTSAAHESSFANTRTTAGTTKSSIETTFPNAVWVEHILPCLDRSSWNSLVEASTFIYKLVSLSKLSSDYHGNICPAVAQPPWPTNIPLQPKRVQQGQGIETVTMSHDGEYLACGSVIGSINIWNLRTGKLQWKKQHPFGNQEAEERAQRPNYYAATADNASDGCSNIPTGSVLRFSPEGYVLACGFGNRVFVWDLENELRKRKRQMIKDRLLRLRNGRVYAFPPQPQLRDDSYEQPHLCHVPDEATPVNRVLASSEQEDCRHQSESGDSYQTLEIECRQGTIYEVTYLGFSKAKNNNNNNNNTPSNQRLIARYGKMAHLWTRQTASHNYVLTHKIALTSSRCQMVSNPSLTCLAVATNGGASSAAARRRRNNDGGEGSSLFSLSSSSSSNNSKKSGGKGIIHVWDLSDTVSACETTGTTKKIKQTNERSQGQQRMQTTSSPTEPITTVSSCPSTKIVAYKNHVVRGLEFLEVESSSNSNTTANETCLVSASLQGTVKFWKKHLPSPKHPRDRYNNACHGEIELEEDEWDETSGGLIHHKENDGQPKYVCVYQFQSPGKIFSLASWSSISSSHCFGSERSSRILLAAGEARGQVRVWKVSPSSLASSSSTGLSTSSPKASLEYRRPGERRSGEYNKQERLEECLSTEVGDHVHYDNIKILAFTPNGKSLAVSRAYDSKIWFQTVWQ